MVYNEGAKYDNQRHGKQDVPCPKRKWDSK